MTEPQFVVKGARRSARNDLLAAAHHYAVVTEANTVDSLVNKTLGGAGLGHPCLFCIS